jgi:hypothetical protein
MTQELPKLPPQLQVATLRSCVLAIARHTSQVVNVSEWERSNGGSSLPSFGAETLCSAPSSR